MEAGYVSGRVEQEMKPERDLQRTIEVEATPTLAMMHQGHARIEDAIEGLAGHLNGLEQSLTGHLLPEQDVKEGEVPAGQPPQAATSLRALVDRERRIYDRIEGLSDMVGSLRVRLDREIG